MSDAIAYGIDFGTTNSLVSIAYPDRIDLAAAEGGSPMMPSIVYLHREGIREAGELAVQTYGAAASFETRCDRCALAHWTGKEYATDCRDAAVGGGCFNARLISEIKGFLAQEVPGSTHSWGRDYSYAEVASTVIRHLKKRADSITGQDVKRAVIGHPVSFHGAEGPRFKMQQRLALDRLRDAAHMAGFNDIQLLEEPAAAVSIEEVDGRVVALDFGGGTFDVVVIDMQPDRAVVRAMQGAAIGGEDFDEAIFTAKLAPIFELDDPAVRGFLSPAVRRRSDAVRALNNRKAMRQLTAATGGHRLLKDILRGGHAYALFQAIEQAKISLSETDQAVIAFDRPGIRLHETLSRQEFESIIASDLDRIGDVIDRALDQAGVRADDVDWVLRTGGSSSIPAFIDRLEGRFARERVVRRDPHETIAVGLGVHARKVWHDET